MQQPRPRYPMHGRMGPQMMGPGPFGGQQHMINPYGGNGQMMGLQQTMNGGRPMMGQNMGRGQGRRNGGGLLSKILGGNKQKNQPAGIGGMRQAGRAAAGGTGGIGSILQTLSNPDSLSGFLNNTQQVLKTAQSIAPMIQQYGPIVKNLPMMWKLYKGFKDLPAEDKSDEHESDAPIMEEDTVSPKNSPKPKQKRKQHTQIEDIEDNKRQNGTSLPKLYI
ncbi:YqfQ family protein [Neobacillus niacini]|uniref:YqfQ family protein n=1 Tax=Neobacillus niacini TaxID=86668 RepID=UPI0021AF3DEA|nr:YqfQ family protein [Neobacillus niacini]